MMTMTVGRRSLAACVAVAVVLAVAGCRSAAYHQDMAVQRAREFLTANAPELTPLEISFVRYNPPTLLTENIFGGDKGGWSTVSERNQICVTWLIPGRQDAYMVFGVGSRRMDDWYPDRLLRRTFTPAEKTRLAAVAAARKYALDNLFFELDRHEYNRVRFSDPVLVQTDFTFDPDSDDAASGGGRTDGGDHGDQIDDRPEPIQLSMVWGDAENQEAVTVICGTAWEDLAGFKIRFGGKVDSGDLRLHTVGSLPADMPADDIDEIDEADPEEPEEPEVCSPAERM